MKPKRLAIEGNRQLIPGRISAYVTNRQLEYGLVIDPEGLRITETFITKGGAALFDKGVALAKLSQSYNHDYPIWPHNDSSPDKAVKAIKEAKAGPFKKTEAVVKGTWTGTIELQSSGGDPYALGTVIVLKRKISSYATIFLTSTIVGWTWRIERGDKWYSDENTYKAKDVSASLADAIIECIEAAAPVLGEACSFRDSRRRSGFDKSWAARHPLKASRTPRDPLEAFGDKADKKTTRKARSSQGARKAKATKAKPTATRATATKPKTTRATATKPKTTRATATKPKTTKARATATKPKTTKATAIKPTATKAAEEMSPQDQVMFTHFAKALENLLEG